MILVAIIAILSLLFFFGWKNFTEDDNVEEKKSKRKILKTIFIIYLIISIIIEICLLVLMGKILLNSHLLFHDFMDVLIIWNIFVSILILNISIICNNKKESILICVVNIINFIYLILNYILGIKLEIDRGLETIILFVGGGIITFTISSVSTIVALLKLKSTKLENTKVLIYKKIIFIVVLVLPVIITSTSYIREKTILISSDVLVQYTHKSSGFNDLAPNKLYALDLENNQEKEITIGAGYIKANYLDEIIGNKKKALEKSYSFYFYKNKEDSNKFEIDTIDYKSVKTVDEEALKKIVSNLEDHKYKNIYQFYVSVYNYKNGNYYIIHPNLSNEELLYKETNYKGSFKYRDISNIYNKSYEVDKTNGTVLIVDK